MPYDVRGYVQVSTPAGGAEVTSLNISVSGEFGVGPGIIHSTFDGLSYNYNAMAVTLGGAASFSPDSNGQLNFSGLALKVGGGWVFLLMLLSLGHIRREICCLADKQLQFRW